MRLTPRLVVCIILCAVGVCASAAECAPSTCALAACEEGGARCVRRGHSGGADVARAARLKYTLRTLWRSRGYGDHVEVDGKVTAKERLMSLNNFLPKPTGEGTAPRARA